MLRSDGPTSGWRQRWNNRRTVRLLLGLVLLWVVAAAIIALLGGAAARDGADRLKALDLAVGLRELLDGDVDAALSAAHDDFDDADRLLGNPILAPAKLFPVAGRQLRSASALAGTSAEALRAATQPVEVLQREIDRNAPAGSERVRALGRLIAELRTIDEVLRLADLGPGEALIGPLYDARVEAAEKLADAHARIRDLLGVAQGMHRLLQGPSQYVVLAANNAEMRIGSGMYLSIGRAEVVDGGLTVDDFEGAGDMALDLPVSLPEDLGQLWGWSGIGSEWRDLGLTARFPVNAALAADMWAALGRPRPDGALMFDVEGISALLRITGPVEVGGRRIDADGVADYLLRDQYDRLRHGGGERQDARREQLSELAEAVLDRFGSARLDIGVLLDELREARDGRHLLAWSSDPAVQSSWELMGVGGDLGASSMLVGLANADGSKLDPYVDVSVQVGAQRDGDEALVELRIDITNRAPDGLSDYVLGVDRSPEYRGLLSAHLPATADDVVLEGLDGLSALGRDGNTVVIAGPVDVSVGAVRTGILRFRVPVAVLDDVVVEPSARIPPVRWRIGAEERTDVFPWQWPPHVP